MANYDDVLRLLERMDRKLNTRLDAIEDKVNTLVISVDMLHQAYAKRASQLDGLLRATPVPCGE